jgi:hypothetical protein
MTGGSSRANATNRRSRQRKFGGKSTTLARLFNLFVCKNDSAESEAMNIETDKLFDWESLIKPEAKKSNNSYSYSFSSSNYNSQFNNQIVSLVAGFESNANEVYNQKPLKVNAIYLLQVCSFVCQKQQ